MKLVEAEIETEQNNAIFEEGQRIKLGFSHFASFAVSKSDAFYGFAIFCAKFRNFAFLTQIRGDFE